MNQAVEGAKSWQLWLNAGLLVLGLVVPGIKDMLTPEFEMSLIAAVNGIIAVWMKVKEQS